MCILCWLHARLVICDNLHFFFPGARQNMTSVILASSTAVLLVSCVENYINLYMGILNVLAWTFIALHMGIWNFLAWSIIASHMGNFVARRC